MKKKRRRKRSAWSVFFKPIKVIFSILLILIILGIGAGGVVYLKFGDEIKACKERADAIVASSRREDFTQPSDTKIYDTDGQVIGVVNSGHYEYVPISEISKNLQDAYVSQEDKRFYKHHGVDMIGLARAGVALIKNKGEITQGGSTITQQVIKNTYLTQEKSFIRKLTELFAAPQLEKKYSKDDIMEFYCNTNFYANRCYGVAKASRYYFNKEAKDLTVWEAATLAGISNNPSRYNPVAHPEAAVEKRNQVIDNMEKNGVITEDQRDYAKAQPLTVDRINEGGTKETYQSSYAIHCAAQELMKNDGFTFEYTFPDKASFDAYKEKYQEAYQEKSDLIRNGGFEIHTSLDSGLQTLLQKNIDDALAKFTDTQENGKLALQGAAVCIDNRTGYVAAISGGRGTEDEYNRGFLSRRQPGSAIKPLIDYAPAFESGYYYPSRLINDHLFDKGPKNDSNRYYGMVSVREALNRSLNTVAWQILSDMGVDYGMDYLKKMHFDGLSYMDNGNISMSIGGFTEGARIVDMARGYSVLANGGMYSNNTCITGINSQYEGDVFQENQPEERIFTEDTAYIATDVLKGTLNQPYGTGRGLGLNIPAAGKTGTTNSSKDTWFCGYTKYYTTAVWVGYDTPKPMPGIYGKTYAGKIWHNFMAECNKGLPAQDWEMPSTVAYYYVDSKGEKTNQNTGKKDLFSSVAEQKALSDTKKWEQEQKLKAQNAQLANAQASAAASAAEQAQAAADLGALINEIKASDNRNDDIQDKLDQAQALLVTLNGTELYEGLKQQLDEAAGELSGVPEKEQSQTAQEMGPDTKPESKPGPKPETPGVPDGVTFGAQPGNQPGSGQGNQPGSQPGSRPESQPGGQPGSQPEGQPGAQPGGSPGGIEAVGPGGQQ